MNKATFDRHLEAVYDDLALIVETRYQERGDDALHDALLAVYRSKAYKKLDSEITDKRFTGWMVQSIIFAIRSKWRDESTHKKRYTLLSDFERMALTHEVRGLDLADAEYPVDIVRDVQQAVGTLSAYHQNLVWAHFYEEKTLREIAKATDETFYRVFTESEIAKSCLRWELREYRPFSYKGP